MKLKPLGDKVVIKVEEPEERVVGGIVLPETAKDIPNKGEVIAVGPGVYVDGKLIPMSVKQGDSVIYRNLPGREIDIDEEGTFIIIREDDILAIIE